jgi:hypothetical protein
MKWFKAVGLPGDICVPCDAVCQAGLDVLITMHRHTDDFSFAGLAKNMMTAVNAFQCPACFV